MASERGDGDPYLGPSATGAGGPVNYCPLCDTRMDSGFCERDGVRTLPWSAVRAAPNWIEVGTVIAGAYRLERMLGEGGMGLVYEATQLSVDRRVALKLLNRGLRPGSDGPADDEGSSPAARTALRRFYRESFLASRIAHPNVVSVYEFGIDLAVGRPFIAMALVRGETLHGVLQRERRLSLARTLTIVTQLADALVAAHAEGLVHRDLKPANIMISDKGGRFEHVTVLDFGVARTFEDASLDVTGPGIPVGTPRYMSPEQAQGTPLDGRSDLYALGCLLNEMLAGKASAEADDALVRPKPVLTLPDDLPAAIADPLVALHDSLLAERPEGRPASARVVRATVEALRQQVIKSGDHTWPAAEGDAEEDEISEAETIIRRKPDSSLPR